MIPTSAEATLKRRNPVGNERFNGAVFLFNVIVEVVLNFNAWLAQGLRAERCEVVER
ncbi:MAG: hypothetical protein U0Y96_11750 [Candidatus Kapaibacterium sp.]|nr:hypothetical protein [Bacteroidota bacterium]